MNTTTTDNYKNDRTNAPPNSIMSTY